MDAQPVFFVSDLHLTGARPRIIEIFLRFLSDTARSGSALYILGDLFEYWIGDDDRADDANEVVLGAIARTAESGVAVYFMPGNRDFLFGKRAAARARMTVLPDPTVVVILNRSILLAHGDAYCIDDAPYQVYRTRVRSPWFRTGFAVLPLAIRGSIARSLRRKSERDKTTKPAAIMDVNRNAIDDAMRNARCDLMIHGHTHRPARHVHVIEGRECERWVLADWYETGSCLRMDAGGLKSMALP
ncbi:MAG: UDP-2,3-diacylglucosamine diphosphatase [Burkholderiales bacterium]